MSQALAIAAVVIAAVGLISSADSCKQARTHQKRARKIQAGRARLEASRQAMETLREAQVKRAQIIQQGANQGVSGSSVVAGAAGSVQSQASSNISFAQQIFGLQQSSRRLMESANELQNQSALASQVATFAANTDSFSSAFSSRATPAPVIDLSFKSGT